LKPFVVEQAPTLVQALHSTLLTGKVLEEFANRSCKSEHYNSRNMWNTLIGKALLLK